MTPPFAPAGYLEAQSRWGTYETFVFRGGDGEAAARLLQTLSSSQASRTFLYGVEDEDWVLVNGGVTPLKSTLHKLQADPRAYLQQTGIGSFPFLSRNMPSRGVRHIARIGKKLNSLEAVLASMFNVTSR